MQHELVPEPIEHHLPAQIDHRQLHSLRIGHPKIALQEHDHGQQGWRHRLSPCARVPVHRLQLCLKRFVEQRLAVIAQPGQFRR